MVDARHRKSHVAAWSTLVVAAAVVAGVALWWSADRRPRLDPTLDRSPAASATLPALPEPVGAKATREVAPPVAPPPDRRDGTTAAEGWTEEAPKPPMKLPVVLHVLAREDGRELPEVEVTRDGDRDPLRGASPIRIEAPSTSSEGDSSHRDVIVRAPGRAPGQLAVDWSSGGERTISLGSAGGLRIEVSGAPEGVELSATLQSVASARRELERVALLQERYSEAARPEWTEWRRRIVETLEWLRREPLDLTPSDALDRRIGYLPSKREVMLTPVGAVDLHDLDVGRWLVAIHARDRPPRVTLAAGQVEIVHDRRELLHFDYRAPTARNSVVLGGDIAFDRAWLDPGRPRLPTTVTFRSLDPIDATDATRKDDRKRKLTATSRPGILSFEPVDLPPGPAVACLEEWRHELLLQVPEASSPASVHLAIPAPADVHLVFDGRSDAPDAVLEMNWQSYDDPSAFRWRPNEEEPHSVKGGAIDFVVPAGPLTLFAGDDPHMFWLHRTSRSVSAGPNELHWMLEPTCRCRVTLREGAATVPLDFPAIAGFSVERGGRVDRLLGMESSSSDPHLTLLIAGAGAATLRFDPNDELHTADPVLVELVEGETIDAVIELRRR